MSTIREKDLGGYIEFLSQKHKIYTPQLNAGTLTLKEYVKDAKTVFNQSLPSASPKNHFLKHGEPFFTFIGDEIYEPTPPAPKTLFGVTPWDNQALRILDDIMFEEPADYYYRIRRQNTTIIVLDDRRKPPNSFTDQIGCNLNEGYDLYLTKFGGEYDVTVGSQKGADYLNAPQIRPGEHHIIQQEKKEKKLDLAAIKKYLDEGPHKKLWMRLAEKCISCGLCSYVCPLTHSFNIEDHQSLNLGVSVRKRNWENIMSQKHLGEDHVKIHEWFRRKFSQSIEERGTPECVGCGRCTTFCPQGIDFEETLSNCEKR
ncbi:MAG: hypothetical protein GF334_01975 [Candidatus Altiarchaeales archaeon]|nr:hypothetical protein [Candidatus Altiarchaeales archaeon]